jgi:hypothetical protein
MCPGPDLPEKPTRFAPLLFALGLGLGLEANRVGLQECGQIGPGANSTPGKSGRGLTDLIPESESSSRRASYMGPEKKYIQQHLKANINKQIVLKKGIRTDSQTLFADFIGASDQEQHRFEILKIQTFF